MDDEKIWKIIHSYFEDNPQCLVSHHIDSYNDFFQKGIFQIFKEKNPVTITSNYDENLGDFRNQCHLYMGGKDGSKIYFGKPVIYDDKDSRYMFPNEARLRNMTYGMTIHYDIDVEFVDILGEGQQPALVLEELETKGGYVYPRPNQHGEQEETESDYKIQQPFRNYKEGGEQSYMDDDEDEAESETKGGAPTKGAPKKPRQIRPTKKTREKRTIKPFQMSPAAAAALREAMDKSMIGPNTQRRTITIEKVYLGKFPIMLQSDFCILRGLDAQTRHTMGECRNDLGGYFIIQGLEKTVVTQEKFADNMLWVHAGKEQTDEDGNTEYITDYMFSADIRSVSENVSKPIRNLSVQIIAPTKSYTNRNIVVNIPNVRKPVPLFIVFRALGIISDRSIIEMCLLDMEKYEHMVDLFAPSVHDAGSIMTQRLALEYIASLTKGKRIEHALEILADYFLPHIGEVNYNEKAYYLGYMVFRLLAVYTGLEPPTDRDNFKYKRMELVGSLMGELFREYYNLQLKAVQVAFEERLLFNKILYADNLPLLIQTFQDEVFKNRIVEAGFTKAFKGNWGAQTHTKRVGIVQDLNRLSFNTYLSHLRKTNLPMPAGVKLVEPRKLHCSQWGYIDPIDTPDGGNIGLHKSLAITTTVTRGGTGLREPLVAWLREKISMKQVSECTPRMLADMTKIMINSYWAGSIMDPFDCMQKIKLYRRNALLPVFMSVTFDIKFNTIYIFTDAGRLCRPIFYKDETTKKMSYDNKEIRDLLEDPHSKISWENLVTGFNEKKGAKSVGGFDYRESKLYELSELYDTKENNPAKLDRFITKKAVLDYIDCSESETALIALSYDQYQENPTKQYTHMEIHESLILGNMCNLIIFAENNPPTRNSFSCGQSKQAVSLYHTNHQVRMDKSAVVLNTGQIPLVKTRYLEHINREENTYGVNVIVAIMCFTGYNVEDAVLLNEGALARGLFRTTYYTTYQSHEESSKSGNATTDLKFTNIESENNVVGTKPGYDYSKLDKYGLIREGTEVNDKTVLIGLTASSSDNKAVKQDQSKTAKKGQLGVVDKAFMTEGEEGERIAKVRVREVRIPNLGDKMACALPTQQVLTHLGWVEIKDIDINVHKVATLDKSGNMCYEHPINKFEYDHNGDMYYVKNKQVHVICTLNHKLYVKKRDRKSYEFIQAKDVMGKMVRFKKSMKNVNPDVEWMRLGDKAYKMDDWLQLLGMFISDGSVNAGAVQLSCHKQRKVDFNIDIMTKLGLEYRHDSYNGCIALNKGKHPEIYEELKKYSLGAANKHLPEYVWNLSQRQSIILMEALLEGDGHTYKDGFSRYGTVSMKLANDICRLAVHCGWSGNTKIADEPDGIEKSFVGKTGYKKDKTITVTQKHTYYKISIIRKQNEPYINKKVNDSNEEKLIQYEGKVYCIEMPSSNLYYMRENNFAASMLIGNSRMGQKGTVGLVIPERDMPFTKDGIRPDMIINPHAIPTRMTIGQLIETIMGKACAGLGGFGDGTPFINKGSKIGVFGELLPKLGFHSSGNEILYDGMSGHQIESEIFIGPTYYMRLKHMVKDKINYRALGPRTALTKQPVSGRANDGGLRIGEMERDAVAAHGITDFLTESMMERGDKYYMAVCNKTGLLAVYNPSKNLFFSPMADGPIKYIGSLDGKELHIENITKYGRDFSVVCVPYSLKLLIQELQAANIQMRIITEDNLPQLEGMSFSKNIEQLMGLEMRDERGVENLAKDIKKRIQEDRLIDMAALNAPLIPATPPPEEESPFKILREDVLEKKPEKVPEEESPPFTFDETPPEIRAELEAREKAKAEVETEATGGGQKDYEIDELVLFRGDPTKSWWQVIDKTSNFVTIQKAVVDDRVLPPVFLGGAPDGAIEVVSHRDLYQWEDIPRMMANGGIPTQMAMGGEPEVPPYMANPMYNGGAGSHQQPSINIQPVITVVGSENKGNIEVPTANPIPNPMMHNGISGPQVATIVGGDGGDDKAKEESKQGGENQPANKPLDFNNLMIKKLE